ncbi:hypothetical protein [Solidesulfovibrio magneticus]|uniref:hypothetical protein n=1 Tax=Solidesulfovibrio magneticus TaxID=184917 RepID=UPI0011D12EEB|nr:hypothetical protein [Solidesulfovibrio magneticus]
MKIVKSLLAVILCWVVQASFVQAQNITQKDIDGITFVYNAAITVLQGSVMSGQVGQQVRGPEFVTAGLAGHHPSAGKFSGFSYSGYTANVSGKPYAVFLLCDQDGRKALLEGVLCKESPSIEASWNAQPPRPCEHHLDVARVCQ